MQAKAVFRLVLFFALVSSLMASAPGAVQGGPLQDSAPPTATPPPGSGGFAVISTQELDLRVNGDDIEAAFLAPSGERFARFHRVERQVCFYTIDGSPQACYPFPEGMAPFLFSVRWSPDSARLVFSDGALLATREDTDIWTLDAATGQFANLTDDGYTGGVVGDPADANLDYSPVWSADGSQIAFLRVVQRGEDLGPITLTIMPSTGGEAVSLRELADFGRFRITDIAWGPDGRTFAYFYDVQGDDDPSLGGIWLAHPDDPGTQQALPVADDISLIRMAFSPDGMTLLATLRRYDGDLRAPEDFPAWLIPVDGGAPLPVHAGHVVYAAAWREGSPTPALAYAVYAGRGHEANGLYFTAQPGQPGALGLAGGYLGPAGVGREMTWAANGALLVAPLLEPLVVVRTGAE
ncbi:MAG: PD40 domain-containing protein [Anaerolineae bacterium]|nr:PD40 domain-containing protein [Anaerolineae bacterium]